MKNIFLIFFLSLLLGGCTEPDGKIPDPEDTTTETTDFDIDYTFLESGSYVQDRNFYLFTLMQQVEDVSGLLKNDATLIAFKEQYMQRVAALAENNDAGINDIGNDLMITAAEISSISSYLGDMAGNNSIIDSLTEQHARPSGAFQKYKSCSDERFIELAFIAACNGINNIIGEYVLGDEPRDDASDGPAYDVTSETYRKLIWDLVSEINANDDNFALFFEPVLYFSLQLLNLNDRNEAGEYEPLETGENKAALEYIPSITWSDYTYATILLLGDSPNSDGDDEQISESAKKRVALAASRWKNKMAPLIIISGANMYPFQTPYYEAVEMKNWMLANYDIPEKAIIVEPHARHTTTNLRNGSRLIYRYGIPVDQKSIVTSSQSHMDYIVSNSYYADCVEHMGFMPVNLGERITDYDVEFTPEDISLFLDSTDPLDP